MVTACGRGLSAGAKCPYVHISAGMRLSTVALYNVTCHRLLTAHAAYHSQLTMMIG